MLETKEIFINTSQLADNPRKAREGCRGLIIKDGKILLSCFTKEDFYLIPGGGMEKNEDLQQACIREVEEETAITVKPEKEFLTVKLFFEDWDFTSHYFICSETGKGKYNLTEKEKSRGLEPRWIDVSKALEIFGSYAEFKETDIERYGSYLREFTALSYFVANLHSRA